MNNLITNKPVYSYLEQVISMVSVSSIPVIDLSRERQVSCKRDLEVQTRIEVRRISYWHIFGLKWSHTKLIKPTLKKKRKKHPTLRLHVNIIFTTIMEIQTSSNKHTCTSHDKQYTILGSCHLNTVMHGDLNFFRSSDCKCMYEEVRNKRTNVRTVIRSSRLPLGLSTVTGHVHT